MLAVYALLGHPQGSTPASVLRRELETRPRRRRRRPARRGRDHADGRPRSGAAPARPRRLGRQLERRCAAGARVPWRRVLVAAAVTSSPSPSAATVLAMRRPRAPAALRRPRCRRSAQHAARKASSPTRSERPDDACWGGPGGGVRPTARRGWSSTPPARALGMYVTAPDGRAVYLTETMWRSYSEISGEEPLDSPAYGGYPVGVERYDEPDGVAIRLDNGGLVMGPRDDTQLFWIPAQGVQRWTRARRRARRARVPVVEPAGRPRRRRHRVPARRPQRRCRERRPAATPADGADRGRDPRRPD